MRTEYIDIEQIKQANEEAGYHFFEPGTMRFFRSRTSTFGYVGGDGNYFVTSEQFDHNSPRLYSVRRINPNGDIDTIGEFQQYQSRNGAHKAAERLANQSRQEN